jgi:small nuclear ribonucleoprotein
MKVSVRLKMSKDRGRMNNVDSYMNLILLDAEEFNGANANPVANYGKVVIRGNNVLFIKIEKDL